MNKSSIVQDQHFVPRFYLENFANESGFICILDLDKKRTRKPRPFSAVCYDKFYYGAQTGVYDDISQQFESYFQKLESYIGKRWPSVIEKIKNYKQISDEDRYVVSLCASMLWLRGPYMREQISKSTEDFYKKILKIKAEGDDFPSDSQGSIRNPGDLFTDDEIRISREIMIKKRYDIKIDNTLHLSLITELERFANFFYDKYWTVYLVNGEKKFITSDTPVIEEMPEKITFLNNTIYHRKHYFVLSPDIQIEMVFPISDTGKKLKRKWVNSEVVFKLNLKRAEGSMFECYSTRVNSLNELIEYHRGLVSKFVRGVIQLTAGRIF